MVGNGKQFRWKISFHTQNKPKPAPPPPPKEFLCPISGSLMSDPVVVPSGQTFDRMSVQVCLDLHFTPPSLGPSRPDFSTLIPNLAMKSTIISWCSDTGSDPPAPLEYSTVAAKVRSMKVAAAVAASSAPRGPVSSPAIRVSDRERELLRGVAEHPPVMFSHAATEVTHRAGHFYSSSSEESVIVGGGDSNSAGTPLPLATRPACYSSTSTSSISSSEMPDVETLTLTTDPTPNSSISSSSVTEEDGILNKLKSPEVHEQETGAILLRKLTRTSEDCRTSICSEKLLQSIKPLVASRYAIVQTNAIAALVNLSLERPNKVTIVRSGFVPLLVECLKSGSDEAQEHAAGALFSLSLEDENKMAIGVLGALQPLMHMLLRSESKQARHDSTLALYHLSLVQGNRIKLVKLGAVPTLLGMVVKADESAGKVLLVLCNLAASNEGRSAMLDANAVGILVGMLRERGGGNAADSESVRENCVAALFALSHGSMRFRGLAKEAQAVEVLREVADRGSERAREKAKRILLIMRGRGEYGDDGESVGGSGDWGSGGLSRSRYRVPLAGIDTPGPNSSNF